DPWFVDETYHNVAGAGRHVSRAVHQPGRAIDAYGPKRPDTAAATHFFETALTGHGRPCRGHHRSGRTPATCDR
ncbi:MAG: DDE-type integrase/transposase/recombinase, partial [Actinomycetia bacterium]|nr:DDE-type integrase/transposase/recombinase [Actinomycetes bacterium]